MDDININICYVCSRRQETVEMRNVILNAEENLPDCLLKPVEWLPCPCLLTLYIDVCVAAMDHPISLTKPHVNIRS